MSNIKLIPVLLTVCLVTSVSILYSVHNFKSKSEKYDFPYKTQIAEAACDKGYTEVLIEGLADARKVSLKGLNVSDVEVRRFSEKCHKQIKKSYKIIEHEKTALLNEVISKMKPFTYAGLPYEAFVIEDEMINAFTVAGGKIYFTTGILAFFENDDELATVMGHEIGHNENGHCIEYLKKMKFWEEYLPEMEIWDIKISEMATNLEDLLTISFNQEDEKCADYCGVYLTYKAGYDPEKGKDIFAKFRKLENNSNREATDLFFRSHPYSEDRYFCLKEYLEMAEKNALRGKKPQKSVDQWLCEHKKTVLAFLILGVLASAFFFWTTVVKSREKNGWAIISTLLYTGSLIYVLSLPCFNFDLNLKSKPGNDGKIAVEKNGTVKTQGGRLILREKPTQKGKELTRMPINSKLYCSFCCCDDEVDGRNGKWCWVKYKNYEGYAWGWFIQLSE
ncbi:MAG: M48 family metalloprotease [Saprospiraceae bacterium]|nr:M48 family metalloprotease [Saprospiraceae bacterium]